jgi:tetratricopeptide (TPR) repeat protein
MLWDLGLRYQAAIYSQGSAAVEKLAGDLGQAERHLREGYQALERMGETARLSTAAGFLAGVYARLGRDQEAERFAGISEATAASEDMGSQVEWRVGLAIVLARRGEAKRAEALAREGVALAASTDVLDLHGDALMDLAHVLHLVGRNSESAEALREALGLFERKGNLVSARRAREALAELIA